jgi:hypothetical protein
MVGNLVASRRLEGVIVKRLIRLVPLSGVVVAIMGAALFATPSSPSSDASAAQVVLFFSDHRRSQQAIAFMVWYAMVLTVIFAASLRMHLLRSGAPEGVIALAFLGTGMFAVGFSVAAGVLFSAADVPTKISPAAEQALNVLQDDVFPVIFVGMVVMMLGWGLAFVRAEAKLLPVWLGWLALVCALVGVIPPISFFGLIGFLVWILVTAVLLFLRQDKVVATVTAESAPTGLG